MCVKEFLGYNCGHCSIPYLRQCPLTDSNPVYPPCEHPAERPIFTNENCHACARVLWNKKVLEEEAKHRDLHENGLCQCEVIFDPEERGRRMRPRAAKGKGKMKDLALEELQYQQDIGHSFADDGGIPFSNRKIGVDPANGAPQQAIYMPIDAHRQKDRALVEAKKAAYKYVGYHTGDFNKQQHRTNSAFAHVEAGNGFPDGGYVDRDQLWHGQLRMGQPGGGMKFYPGVIPMLPALPPIPSSQDFGTFKSSRGPESSSDFSTVKPSKVKVPSNVDFSPVKSSRHWQRGTSEPSESSESSDPRGANHPTSLYTGSPNVTPRPEHVEVEKKEEPELSSVDDVEVSVPSMSPMIVSSDMAKTMSQ